MTGIVNYFKGTLQTYVDVSNKRDSVK